LIRMLFLLRFFVWIDLWANLDKGEVCRFLCAKLNEISMANESRKSLVCIEKAWDEVRMKLEI
jgi:hypothetical protein